MLQTKGGKKDKRANPSTKNIPRSVDKNVLLNSGPTSILGTTWKLSSKWFVIGALSLAELGTMIPKSGGEYPYILAGLGDAPGYLFSWASIWMLKTSSVSIICLTCAEYIMVPIFDDDCGLPPYVITKCLAIAVLCES